MVLLIFHTYLLFDCAQFLLYVPVACASQALWNRGGGGGTENSQTSTESFARVVEYFSTTQQKCIPFF